MDTEISQGFNKMISDVSKDIIRSEKKHVIIMNNGYDVCHGFDGSLVIFTKDSGNNYTHISMTVSLAKSLIIEIEKHIKEYEEINGTILSASEFQKKIKEFKKD